MALELVAGAGLGAAFGELLKEVLDRTDETLEFDTLLTGLETTLKNIEPVFTKIAELSQVLNRPVEETATFTSLLEHGKELVVECSRIGAWNVMEKESHANKLIHLDNELMRFFHIDMQALLVSTNLSILARIKGLTASSRAGGFSGSCSVPGPPEFVVGLDDHLLRLKYILLEDDSTRVLVVSAPGGFGKTTLVKKLCHDDEIKGIFGDNILYVTVSKETSLMSIARNLFKHYGINDFDFKTEEDAKNQIENMMRLKGCGKMLLVLDDVWCKTEYVIQDLKFEIQGYKMLVTSRSLCARYNSTYDLSLLNAEDAKTLFCHYAFATDESAINTMPTDLVNKMVAFCKRIPLALTVVGASLCGRPEVIWRSTLKKWSEGRSILESHEQLLFCLQTSIDALDELLKNCFLDLGSFPEDEQISGMALMDMWVEFYKLDREGVYASENLLVLKSRNLINIFQNRKASGETEGHCSQYRVAPHDVLRELAIHLSKQEPEAERERLFMEIHGNNFPEWWTRATQQPVNARIISISTDEQFSSNWYDLNASNIEVLILNVRSENYTLPRFIERMSQLKVLIIIGYGAYPTQLQNLQVLGSLSKLSRIRFEHVSVSSSVQVIFTLQTLKKLTFFICKIGDALNECAIESPYMLEHLKELEIDLCYDLKELPAALCSSVNLQKLIITNCQELEFLPEELGNLSNLEVLRVHCCTKLKELPESIESLRKLRLVDISNCSSITALPEQICELSSLRVIDISGCEGLEKLPMSLTQLKQLEDVWCDEERECLWRNIESDHCDVKINIVEEDSIRDIHSLLFM